MNTFKDIDAILSKWAENNDVVWLTEYQDNDVRTFVIAPGSKNSVQIWVDPTEGGRTTVHVCQNNNGRRSKKEESYPSEIRYLHNTLDRALSNAKQWLNSASPSGGVGG